MQHGERRIAEHGAQPLLELPRSLTSSYDVAFSLAVACSAVSSIAIWLAAPRRVRVVSLPRRRAGRE